MHAIEKIIAKAAGQKSVGKGEIYNCKVDLAGINDLYLQTLRSFFEMGGQKVYDSEKIIMFFDHYSPPSTITQAENQRQFREFCRNQGIGLLMDIDQGVCHQVLADKGLIHPGMVIVVTDSHSTTHGAFGAFGTGVGATDLAIILMTGKLWFRVPEVVRINLEGKLPKGVYAKDIILHIIGSLGADYAVYKAVEFTGPLLKKLNLAERMTLCNMTTEMGAKTSYIQPDEIILNYLKSKGNPACEIYTTDSDYEYADQLNFDVTELKPQLSAPHSVDNVCDIDNFVGTTINQAYLGSCTNGRIEDIEIAAKILQGKKIHSNMRFILAPASKTVLLEAMNKGYIQILVEAGATIVTPGCAACLGTHQGMLADGDICITSTSRNFPGRMGSTKAEIFVASPASVAAAALTGQITDPSQYIE